MMTHHDPQDDPDVDAVVEALGQSYVLDVLDAVAGEPLSARAIAGEAAVPTTTLYRRLDALVDAGLVEERMELDGDGDHYHVYRARLQRLRVERTGDGLTIDVAFADASDPVTAHDPESTTVQRA